MSEFEKPLLHPIFRIREKGQLAKDTKVEMEILQESELVDGSVLKRRPFTVLIHVDGFTGESLSRNHTHSPAFQSKAV